MKSGGSYYKAGNDISGRWEQYLKSRVLKKVGAVF
jgi:hypothetical protein